MSKPVVTPLGPALNIAKGAHWDNRTGFLYMVDMFKGTVHSYNPKNKCFKTATVGKSCEPQPMAIIIPTEGGTEEFIISWKNDLSKITWNGVSCATSEPEVVQNLESNTSTNRINNGKVDPMNRLWAGTTGKRLSEDELVFEKCKAAMYCLHEASTVEKILDKVSVSNGMEWSCDKKTFYYADSAKFKLEAYDYCNDSAKICNPRTILDLKKDKVCGVLDGIAMDSDGKLYITNYMGCQVIVFDPKCNKICKKIKIPAEEVTSLCWGGPSYDLLYVTTGNTKPNKKCPQAGRLFEICGLGVRGVPCRNASI